MAFQEYRYKVELSYIHKSKETKITPESIKFIHIDSDYLGKKAFPIIFLGVNLEFEVYKNMISNMKEDTVVFALTKYIVDENNSGVVETKIVKDEFLYFFDKSNIGEDEDTAEADESEHVSSADQAIRSLNLKLGLINLSILNMCKEIQNDVLTGNMSSILYYYLKRGNKVIMEPLDNNKSFTNIIIPPIPTINRLLEYLNNICSFYNSSYRFFIDLNKNVYLLSNSGNGVETKDSKYSSIMIKSSGDSSNASTKEPGIEIDTKNKCYNIYLDTSNTFTNINLYKDKEVNKIITISSNGVIKQSKLDTSNNAKGTRTSIYRIFNENNNEINNIKNLIEAEKVMLTISKAGVDCSIVTPEKSINVTNSKVYKEYDGKYILAGKQESFIMNDGENFTCTTTLKLLRIKS